MGYYNAGTITLANGGTAVTGSGTAWGPYAGMSALLVAKGSTAAVASITANGSMTIVDPWEGPNLSASKYNLVILSGGSSLASATVEVLQGLRSGALQNVSGGAFLKANPTSRAFYKTGAGSLSVKAGTVIGLGSSTFSFSMDTQVIMPTLVPGTDYAKYICSDGTIRADANFSYPTGYSPFTSRMIGGFHYAPGGNAVGQSGGDSTPQINENSIWDIKFRPAAPDPRGMTLVNDAFWGDIYFCNTNPEANGTSRYNFKIADGSSPPKIPTAFGGNGSTDYGAFKWWHAVEVGNVSGKQLLSYDEFCAIAYGTTEGVSTGSDPDYTILRPAYTSRCGAQLVSGNIWQWGRNLSFFPGANGEGWKDIAEQRGQMYLANDRGSVAAVFGGSCDNGASAGSRASHWAISPSVSIWYIGARFRCDHLVHV